MAKPRGGLTKWFKEDWRDVATGKPCGRKSAVTKKRAAGNTGGKPTSIKWSVSPTGRKRKRVSKKR